MNASCSYFTFTFNAQAIMQVTPGGNASSQTNSCCKSSNSLPYTPLHTGRWLEIKCSGMNHADYATGKCKSSNKTPVASHQGRSPPPPPPLPNHPKKILSSLPHTPLHTGRWTVNKCSGMSHASQARWKCKSSNKLLCTASHQTKK